VSLARRLEPLQSEMKARVRRSPASGGAGGAATNSGLNWWFLLWLTRCLFAEIVVGGDRLKALAVRCQLPWDGAVEAPLVVGDTRTSFSSARPTGRKAVIEVFEE